MFADNAYIKFFTAEPYFYHSLLTSFFGFRLTPEGEVFKGADRKKHLLDYVNT